MSTAAARRPPRALVLAFGAAAAIAVLSTAVWTVFGLPRANLVSYGMQFLMAAFSVICTAEAARRMRGRHRLAWAFLSGAFTLIFLGTIDAVLRILRGETIDPTAPDATFQALALPVACAGITLFIATFLRIGRVRILLDSFIAVLGVICLSWVLGLADLAAASHQDAFAKFTTILYPMVDVLYFAPVLCLALTVPRRHKGSLGVLGVALLSSLAPDMHYAAMSALQQPYHGGYVLEIGWVLAFTAVGYAALRARTIEPEDLEAQRTSIWRIGLPYVAVALCGAAISYQEIVQGRIDAIMVWCLAALCILLSMRQILELRENHALSEALRTQSLRQAEARFASLVENSSDIILVVDYDLDIRYVSGAVRTLVGVTPEELQGRPLDALVHEDDVQEVCSHLAEIVLGQTPRRLQFRVTTSEGAWRYLEALPSSLFNDEHANGIVLNTSDVTERRQLELKLRRDAAHDPLTGLTNRKALLEHMEHALAVAARRNGTIGLLFIDLNDFKGINDTAGHVVGDQVLKVVADRLQGCIRLADSAARYGGDEFAVVIDDCPGADGAYTLATKIRDVLREPIVFHGFRRVVGASIGVALSLPDDDVTQLVMRADAVMYEAKRSHTDIGIDPLHKPTVALASGGGKQAG
jgi:diguanylate cyclase (GGDEF)-like protein/PAS domain S-box-containing protein